MLDLNSKLNNCTICKKEYTSAHAEVAPGILIYVCKECMEAAKEHFIWICMNCGKVYFRPKQLVIDRLTNEAMKRAYIECEDLQIIQGIDICVSCDPEGVFNYMENQKMAMEC